MPRPRRKAPAGRKTRSKKQQQQQQQVASANDWFTIRGILDERETKAGQVEYLVDWDDHPETGEKYEPTWSDAVTELALDEWTKRKQLLREKEAEEKKLLAEEHPLPSEDERETPLPSAEREGSQDSQPPRPSNWRTLKRVTSASTRPRSSSGDPSDRPRKIQRTAYSLTPSEEPPSITSRASVASYESFASPELDVRRAQASTFYVALGPKDPSFDREYQTQTAPNTQNSGGSSQPLAELEAEDERQAINSQISARTVPDSQDPSGESWLADSNVAAASQALPSVRGALGSNSPRPSNTSEIPSRQPETQFSSAENHNSATIDSNPQPNSPKTTAVSAPHVSHEPGTGSQDSSVFLTQPPVRNFDVGESSLQSLQSPKAQSSSHSAVQETPTHESSHIPVVDNRPAVDAQVVLQNDFGSEEDPLNTRSTRQSEADPSEAGSLSEALLESISHAFSAGQTTRKEGTMEGEGSERQRTAEDLSHLVNLDHGTPEPEHTTGMPPPEHPPESAVDSPLLSSSDPQQPSAIDMLHRMVDEAFSTPSHPPSATHILDEPQHHQQSTISPADISKHTELEGTALPFMPSLTTHEPPSSNLFEAASSEIPPQMGQIASGQASSRSTESDVGPQDPKHIITLPFQASLRPLYDDTLLEYKQEVTEFGGIFNSEIYVPPNEALVGKIDELLGRLFSICDYPQDAVGTVLESLPPAQLAKFTCDANAKFNFLFELLQGLQKDVNVLVVARSIELLRLLHALTQALDVECVCDALGVTDRHSASAARVRLALSDEEVDAFSFEVVVGFDHTFGSSPASRRLEADEDKRVKGPLVLILVTTHSIEHIDLHVPSDLGSLERKNALLAAIVHARKLVSDPDRGYPEPHELAGLFIQYLNGDVDGVIWEPIPIPDDILDIYLTSQGRSQMPPTATLDDNGRKRKLDEPEDDDDEPKRMRVGPSKEPAVKDDELPLPDEVRDLLDSVDPSSTAIGSTQVRVQVSLAVLQAIAEQRAELERQVTANNVEEATTVLIKGLSQRIKEYERTSSKIYDDHRQALGDRTEFEKQKLKAEAALQAATAAAQKESDKARSHIESLEATIARLTTDGAGEDSPLAVSERQLKEAQGKIHTLEKRLENAQNDASYARDLYQQASAAASELRSENSRLLEQNAALDKSRTETLEYVHRVQTDNESRELLGQLGQIKQQLRERERELDGLRDDVRQMKNGRRETRQSSVPRSPRMGIMSPRPGRVYGGSASRGTSPAAAGVDGPGAQYMSVQQQGNGRWNHLRD
ncbi:decaprenyl-diphosphate synthase subunit 1 [Purpureocillium lavendulum]|uniref:Decaprenyl-diphosphate synthase subunit 1 n=1 Tax=Purpureocillium lavendulum TaxID=1247861 RepID=A0AB34FHD1_9HYPO|nr:decaprenyl-diphosphate synthase subunit 1 [Purpureocillium lavendulum]